MELNHVILVTGSYDHTLKFWDAIRGDVIETLEFGEDVPFSYLNNYK